MHGCEKLIIRTDPPSGQWVNNNDIKQNDLQIFQLGQVSEGPFLNHPQTVDILHQTAGIKMRKSYNIAVSGCQQTNTEKPIHTSAALKVKD